MIDKLPLIIIAALCFFLGLIYNQFGFLEFMGLSVVSGLTVGLLIKKLIVKK